MLKRILITVLFLSFAAAPAFAGFDEGKKAYDKKDWPAAIKELRPLAESGDDRAMVILGNMYHSGYGVVSSEKEAMRLYKRAATEKNNTQAMDAIGAMYVSAVGVEQNLMTARDWFKRSALLGDQAGAFFYASLLLGNKTPPNNLPPDLYNAYKWFKIGAQKKDDLKLQNLCSKMALGIAKKLLPKDQTDKADKEAADWKPVGVETLGPVPPDPSRLKIAPPGPQFLPKPRTAPATPVTPPAPTNSLPPSAAPDKPADPAAPPAK